MSVARLATGVALVVTLIIPVGAVAQTEDDASDPVGTRKIVRIWTDKDGLVLIDSETPETVDVRNLDVVISPPEDRPEALQGLPMNRPFLTLDGIEPGANFGLVRVYESNGDSALFGDDGRSPVVPQIVIDGDGMRWMPTQRHVQLPPLCSGVGPAEACLDQSFREALVDEILGQPPETGSLPPDVGEYGGDLLLVSTTVEGSGSIFGLGGGITFDQVVSASPDKEGIVLVEGSIAVNDAYGGSLRSVRAQVVDIDATSGEFVRRLSNRWMHEGIILDRGAGTWRTPVACGPQDGTLIVATEVELRRVGAGLPGALGEGFEPLEGGTSLVVTDITNIDCPGQLIGRGTDILDLPGTDAFDPSAPGSELGAGLVCMAFEIVHEKLQVGSGDNLVEFLSSIKGRGVIMVRGTTEEMLSYAVVGGSSVGQALINPLVPGTSPGGDLEGYLLLDSGPASLYEFDFEAGINSIGKKRIKKLEIRANGGRVDLTEQARDAIGRDFIRVRPRETSGGNCPDDFSDLDIGYLPEVLPWVSE